MRPSCRSAAAFLFRNALRRASTGALAYVLLGLAALPAAHAETRDYYFTRLGAEHGLTQTSVTALAQDPQGFVWVATQGGLHRYDGQRYVPYRHDPRNPSSLPDSYVTALALDGDRALWIGSYSQYVARLDLRTGHIRRYAAAPTSGQAERQVLAMLPRGEHLWIGTLAGLERFDPTTGQRERVLQLDPDRMRAAPTQQLLADGAGTLWYASASGLFRIGRDGHARLVGEPVATGSLLLDHRGRLWVGRRDGLHRLRKDGAGLEKAWPIAGGPATPDVHALVETPDGQLWISVHHHGLVRFDPETGRTRTLREQPGVAASLPEDTIASLLVDAGGMLWVGGRIRGVAVVDPRGARFGYVFDLDTRPARADAEESVRAVHEDEEGQLWIATDDSRLLRYDIARDQFSDQTARLPTDPGRTPPRVLAIAGAGSGRLWLATERGLMRRDSATGDITTVPLGQHGTLHLRSLLVDRAGDVWLGTLDRGALHYQVRNSRVVHYSHNGTGPRRLAHPAVHALLEDRRGRIWFGTGDGVDLLDRSSDMLRHFRHTPDSHDGLPGSLVRALHETADGTVWIGTHAGLSRAVEQSHGGIAFQHPLPAALHGRPVPSVFSIADSATTSGKGRRLWLGTSAGIIQFDTATSQARVYGLADGLQDLEFNGGAATQLADGRIALGGVRGVNLFRPGQVRDAAYEPPLRLLAARVGANAAGDAGVLWQPAEIAVPDGADVLRLRVGALDFAPAVDIHYRYRMDGFDRRWIDNGAHPDITYSQLPPGEYMFRAQATNRDGLWGSRELQIPVRVAPPLWRHPLALAAIAAVVLLLAVAAGWRWRQNRRREQGYFQQIREREERLQLALWASGEQFWDYDPTKRTLHRMRDGADSETSPERGALSQVGASEDIHPDDLLAVSTAMLRHLRGKVALFESEHRIRNGDGWDWVLARGRVVERDASGEPLRVAGTARNVTLNHDAERDRRISSEVLRSMAEAVVVFDDEFRFVSINPAFSRITGYDDAEIMRRPTSLLDSHQHDPAFYRQMRGELEKHGRWSGEIWQQRRDGSEFLCWLQASVVADSDGGTRYVAVMSDITDQKRAEQELRHLAKFDTLTSLPNRTLLSERLSRAIVHARRNNRKIAVLFLDLDRFKDINDSLGHAAGDRILRAAAARLQEIVGVEHTVARLGGDEFTVVLEDIGSAEDAEAVAREIIRAFERPLGFDERHEVTISPSIGISLYPDHAQVPTDLLKHADTAMYQAKAAGRRTYMRYTDAMDIEIRRRATISAALRKVLDRNELRLVFQPRLSLADGRINGVEALLRWQSGEYGNIPPMQFIALAEENGLILEIGEWALREACRTLRHWRDSGLTRLSMAVNVSSLQLLRGDLPGLLGRVLAEFDLPPQYLELELTESVVMTNAAQTANTLQAFRTLGVSLAIDDFGTGYSSLAYLKRLPITTLKIDKEFIDDLTLDPDDEAITSTIISMGHSLGLNVVAEGVETEAQMHFLQNHGCDEIQGYWLARPLESEQCLAFIQDWTPERAATILSDASADLLDRPVLTALS